MRDTKLPLKRKLRFAFTVKSPLRLFFTIFIMVLAFSITGMCFVLAFYDEPLAIRQTFSRTRDFFEVTRRDHEMMSVSEIEEMEQELRAPYGIVKMYSVELQLESSAFRTHLNSKFSTCSDKLAFFSDDFLKAEEFLAGGMPKDSGEVLLSSCNASAILISEGRDDDGFDTLIGKEISVGFKEAYFNEEELAECESFRISGVYDNSACEFQYGFYGQLPLISSYPGCSFESRSEKAYSGTMVFHKDYFIQRFGQEFERARFLNPREDEFAYRYLEHIDSSEVYFSSFITNDMKYYNDIEKLAREFSIPAVFFAVFSVLLLYQFATISIDRKRGVTGTLRALGCRGGDVMQIFLIENGFIGLVTGIISCGTTACSVPILNKILMKSLNVDVSFLGFHPLVFVFIMALSLCASLLSAAIPVYLESKKFPIDVIKSSE